MGISAKQDVDGRDSAFGRPGHDAEMVARVECDTHLRLALPQRQSDDDTDRPIQSVRGEERAQAHDPAKCERFADKIMR
jgi:hypothetical protein